MILISLGDILLMGHPLKPAGAVFFISMGYLLFMGPSIETRWGIVLYLFTTHPSSRSHFLLMAIESHCGTDKITASHWELLQPGGRAQHFLPRQKLRFGTLGEPFFHCISKENWTCLHQHWTSGGKLHLLQLSHICHCRKTAATIEWD